MTQLTIALISLSFFIGFVSYLVPKLSRWLAVGVACASAVYAALLFLEPSPIKIQLLDSFGVTLIADQLSSFFILTNAIVTLAVILYCWQSGKSAFFFMQLVILHSSVNATFICADFISLYVALEVISIAAFLLIGYPRRDKTIWVALRYLFISNTAMLFYLVGAVLVYQVNHSFSFEGLGRSPADAVALIFLGLLVKGGIFVSGLWLPLTHSESETPVSAMLSGVVVKAGVFPLVRCALMIEELDPIVRFFGVGTALLGVVYAVFEKDTKRTLAFSTISQLGFIVAAPVVSGFYALTHGLVKSALFLIAGILPSRDFKQLQQQPMPTQVWIALVIASFSISGFPLLSGFGAKVLTSKNLLSWQVVAMNIAALGTAIIFSKFIFLPHQSTPEKSKLQPGFWGAIAILLGGLVAANVFYYEAYTLGNIVKPLAIIILGWLTYLLLLKKVEIKLPGILEKFDHLVGGMSLMLILLFWSVWTKSPIVR